MISEPSITLEFDEHARFYLPREEIAGQYVVDIDDANAVHAIESSVLWYTEGKGEEDLAVHYFDRHSRIEGHFFDVTVPRRFGTVLPHSPLSYSGRILKIRWCVRVRVFLRSGREVIAEQPFRLGDVGRGT